MSKAATLRLIDDLKSRWPDNIALQCFDVTWFLSLDGPLQNRLLHCMQSGLQNPDSEVGCYANHPSDYDDLAPYFTRVLARFHGVDPDTRQVNNWSFAGIADLPDDGILDLGEFDLLPLSMRVRVGRNLQDFPLPAAMDRTNRVALEDRMTQAFDRLIAMPEFGGAYHSLTPGHANQIDSLTYNTLVDEHRMFKDVSHDRYLSAAGIASDWPYGRGCYISTDNEFLIWVGEEDHLRLMCMARGTVLNEVFNRLKSALDVVGGFEGLDFAVSPQFGIITSCPTNLGTGMRASLHIPFPELTRGGSADHLKQIARCHGLSVRGLDGEHTDIGADGTVDISPTARFGVTEAQIIATLYKGVAALKVSEDALSG